MNLVIEDYHQEKFGRNYIEENTIRLLGKLGIKKSSSMNLTIYFSQDMISEEYTYGYTDARWFGREFIGDIEIKSGLCEEDFLLTLAHELAHIRQHYRGDLIINQNEFEWNGEQYPKDTPYEDRPWEKEALSFEKNVYICKPLS